MTRAGEKEIDEGIYLDDQNAIFFLKDGFRVPRVWIAYAHHRALAHKFSCILFLPGQYLADVPPVERADLSPMEEA